MSSDERGPICCWTETPSVQSDGRTPQPSRMPASKLFVRMFLPKFVFDMTPQRSPPVARRSCAAGFEQIAVGHEIAVRVDPCPRHACRSEGRRGLRHAQRGIRVGVHARDAGALEVPAEGHLDRGPAVPNRSYATPTLGVMSL